MRNQGFVFVSVEGYYATVRTSCDHGPTRQVISWVKSLDDAEVFAHDHVARRKFKELEKAQALQAVETRVVQFQTWVVEPKPAPAPCAPPAPGVPPPAAVRAPWLQDDCDRRARINGDMRYFKDTDVLPVGVAQVEFRNGRNAWLEKYAGGGA